MSEVSVAKTANRSVVGTMNEFALLAEGYREHSAATRDHLNAKLRLELGSRQSFTLVANSLRQHDTQDPGGLTRALMEQNPRQVAAGQVGAYAGSADHLVSEALYLADPDGLGIEVYADRPRAQWKTNGREITMATEPLDLRALVRASGGEPWAGMPAGTTIGHVHFHVATLGEAEAFYHRVLGLDKVVWSYPGALFFSVGGYHHHVGANTWAGEAPVATSADARLLEWELRLPTANDIASAAANAAHAGYEIHEAGNDRLITDPSRITVRLTT